jgi:hypothetical protein
MRVRNVEAIAKEQKRMKKEQLRIDKLRKQISTN